MDLPLLGLVSLSLVPNGRVRCAADSPFGSKRCPLAVFLPCCYHEVTTVVVFIVLESAGAVKSNISVDTKTNNRVIPDTRN